MGTRSLTVVKSVYKSKYEDDVLTNMVMYRQFDSHEWDYGVELMEFINQRTIVNGFGLDDDPNHVANGPDDLAAQIVAHFKMQQPLGGIYLVSVNRELDEEYVYEVSVVPAGFVGEEPDQGSVHIRVWQENDAPFFEGSALEFLSQYQAQPTLHT
jgi:hypothetical protein